LTFILSAEGGTLEPTVVGESLQVIFEGLKMIFAGCNVKIGVGRQCYKPRDYKIAFNEACQALSFATPKQGNEEGVIFYHSLRLMGVLLNPANEQTLPVFVRLILGKLHDYSVAHNINLIESLECYLKHNCCIQSAARELFIHPNTLRYRLEKAEKVSGLDLTDNDTKLELQLAIKLYKYQGELLWKV
jgi:DNA-binding PucR family transcriptional regulator